MEIGTLCFVLLISQATVDESQTSSSPFLRALMTAVCKAAVKGKRLCHLEEKLYNATSELTPHPALPQQTIPPTVEWTRPSSRRDCLYYSSTLTQTLSDSCKHFMHFRR